MKTKLTPGNLSKLTGRTIKWQCPIYKENIGHYGYGLDGGTAEIIEVDVVRRKPIIRANIIEGGNIMHVFNEWGGGLKYNDHPLCFSDGDRYVSYEIKLPFDISNIKDTLSKLYLERVEKSFKAIKGYISKFNSSKYTRSQVYVADINVRRHFRELQSEAEKISDYFDTTNGSMTRWLSKISENIDKAIEYNINKIQR